MNQPNYPDTSPGLSMAGYPQADRGPTANSLRRLMLRWGGHVLIGLGFIGMLLPVVPTTVFWIGAAICYARSSPSIYQKLIGHQQFGKPIQLYLEQGVISTKGKSAALLGMSFSAVLIGLSPLTFTPTLAVMLTLAGAAIYVVTRPVNISAR